MENTYSNKWVKTDKVFCVCLKSIQVYLAAILLRKLLENIAELLGEFCFEETFPI